MTNKEDTILIKRYASRRLYNTQISDYVTLEQVAQYIRDGSDVKIIDRKTGDDLTRQYLMQIITDYESRGENVLPINVLTDIVRSYNDQAQSFIPDFLAQSYEMLKTQQEEALSKFQQNIPDNLNPLNAMQNIQGLEQWQQMQSDFLNQMMSPIAQNMSQNWAKENQASEQEEENDRAKETAKTSKPTKKTKNTKKTEAKEPSSNNEDDIELMKKQLSELQNKLQNM